MAYKPVSDYGIIGNMVSAVLIAKDGSIDWCCLPRFDSPSIFAAILDDEKGGRFSIEPRSHFESRQSYLNDTNVLETVFQTETGTVMLTDFMPCYRRADGRLVQFNEIHRIAECTHGEADLKVTFQPKPEYATFDFTLDVTKYGVVVTGGGTHISLSLSVPSKALGDQATAIVKLRRGDKAAFVLRYGSDRPLTGVIKNSLNKLSRTKAYWQQQAEGCVFSGPYREYIVRSYLALHLLVYSPTGAIIAAPTTSLPEEIGGERNWDYRFTWLRDASLTLNAFSALGHKEEAIGFMKWLLNVCDKCGPKAQILYGIDFQEPFYERTLDHLEGYRKSRPVRIGNDAYSQRQLDIFGEVLEAAYNYVEIGGYISNKDWILLETFVDAACELWQEPDSGIWEVRGGPFHFVHSKVMCWVALDRGIRLAQRLGQTEKVSHWRKTAEEIRNDILNKGWNPGKEAFTQHYDTEALDASALLIPLFGFLPVSDRRIKSTIDHVAEELSWNGLLRRYRTDETEDGLKGSEGAFLWCTFWLVRNLLRLGNVEDAVELYERLLGYCNHLGLLSEMVDPVSGETLGNFPQALTHLAVIITGLELTEAIKEKRVEVEGEA
ncbi:glycoside hydrolase family 15 protein [Chloroflexota bacterium]